MKTTRRKLLRNLGTTGLGFAGLQACASFPMPDLLYRENLEDDPDGIIHLPPYFNYRVLSRTGTPMDDGLAVPARHDGMGAFPGPNGRIVLIRNHELTGKEHDLSAFASGGTLSASEFARFYDPGGGETPSLGCTTTVVYEPEEGVVEAQFMSLGGTLRNCAGGVTPWNSWISCEESTQRANSRHDVDHGYCFEVPRTVKPGLVKAVPLRALGRFNHEAAAVDHQTGIVYLTEDRHDSLFYRFIPDSPGNLAEGGRLQALKIREAGLEDTRNWHGTSLPLGEKTSIEWVDLRDPDSPGDDLRDQGHLDKNAAIFARGEGIWISDRELYFCCTNGGPKKRGQIFRYTLSHLEGTPGEWRRPAYLELFVEPDKDAGLRQPDNLVVTPWGELLVCEDGLGSDRIVRVDRSGEIHSFARNAMNDSEFAGATFSPDGKILFVNVQDPGFTLAISGPWPDGTLF